MARSTEFTAIWSSSTKKYKLSPRDPKPREVERRVKETVRQRLEAELTGTETPEAVGKRVRRLVGEALDF
jgi:hypothetical protein